jgi:hypothetical protein
MAQADLETVTIGANEFASEVGESNPDPGVHSLSAITAPISSPRWSVWQWSRNGVLRPRIPVGHAGTT